MTGAGGINGLKNTLKAQNQLINIEAGNLTRSQVPGSQSIRGTLETTDFVNVLGKNQPGPGAGISATTSDFSQGAIQRTGFTTDLAISGTGFFVLFDEDNNFFYTRRGDFHFDNEGNLVNSRGLYVGSFDPQTQAIEKTTVEINPVVGQLGQDILDELKATPNQTNTDLATALGQPQAAVDAELNSLEGAGYVRTQISGPNVFYQSNLGQVGDQIDFDREGFLINASRGNGRGNQIALAVFQNPQGLTSSVHGGEVYKATDAASPAGIPEFGGPGDVKLGLGHIESQALEESTAQVPAALGFIGVLQRNFTSTAQAMKVFLGAWDDLLSTLRA